MAAIPGPIEGRVVKARRWIVTLLVTASKRGVACAALLEQALAEPVQVAGNLRRAAALLRRQQHRAVVLDAAMAEANPEGLDQMLNSAGEAVPVYVNLAISNTDRVTQEVRHALRRRAELRRQAMQAAETLLGNELRDALTGILLSAELALQSPELPPDAEEKLKTVRQLASRIRARLESGGLESSQEFSPQTVKAVS
jgi:hypothetical protein